MAPRCVGTTRAGQPCSAKPLPGSDRCPWHDPAWDERRKEWSVRGGHGKSNRARAAKQLPAGVLSNDQLRGVLGLTIAKVLNGAVEPGVGSSVASLARAYLAVVEASALEELTARLDELERLVARGRSA